MPRPFTVDDLEHGFQEANPMEQRTDMGKILRSGLNQVAATIPEGASGVAVLVIDSTGAEIGAAWKTKRGWTIEPSLKAEIKRGRIKDMSFLTRVTW